MTFGYKQIVWDGETCFHCGKDLHGECSQLDDMYFCSEACLGAYLIEANEDDINWIDFITPEEYKQQALEDHYDRMHDGGY